MAKSKTVPETEGAAASELPAWYDAEIHAPGDGGIYHAATGTLLGEDGEPASAALRLQRQLAAEAEVEATVEDAAPVAPVEHNFLVQE